MDLEFVKSLKASVDQSAHLLSTSLG